MMVINLQYYTVVSNIYIVSYRHYRGFVQVYKKTIIKQKATRWGQDAGNPKKIEVKKELLCEFLVEIPKVRYTFT